ncbi:YbaB/EbfC family nucleoid-associated protein [Nocardia sp. NPDC058705]|uniref:YbaB/EbfC family nucleoid-associated protein n=1 Tax=Nocardia sp. NPDC058705 TaxID=3346609 RepID=UPI0036819A50
MSNEQARADMENILDGVQQQLRNIARVQQERAELTATVTVRKRVTVSVNADGTVIETKFATDIADLSYSEIATAITEAAQKAAAEVAARGQELLEPMRETRARMPKLSDLVEGVPDLTGAIAPLPVVSTAPPGAEERRFRTTAEDGTRSMVFDDVVPGAAEGQGRGVTDSSW